MRHEETHTKGQPCSVKGCREVARWIICGDNVEEQAAIEKTLLAVGGIKMGHIPTLKTFRKFYLCLICDKKIISNPSMANWI